MTTSLQFFSLPGWIGILLKGRVDAFNDKRLMDSVEHLVRQNPRARLAVDLSGAEFLSLQMMRFLAGLRRELLLQNGDVVLIHPSHPVRRQIEIFLGIKIFPVYQSIQELELGEHFLARSEYLVSEPLSTRV